MSERCLIISTHIHGPVTWSEALGWVLSWTALSINQACALERMWLPLWTWASLRPSASFLWIVQIYFHFSQSLPSFWLFIYSSNIWVLAINKMLHQAQWEQEYANSFTTLESNLNTGWIFLIKMHEVRSISHFEVAKILNYSHELYYLSIPNFLSPYL